jgi:hypothetical protein
VNSVMEIFPFFALGALGIATFVVASGALRSALRAEKQGEDRFELLREERRVLTEELEFERRERLQVQRRVKQLMREHPHLELEREIQRLSEELEREGRLRNHRERQRLSEELLSAWSESFGSWIGCSKKGKGLVTPPRRAYGEPCSAATSVRVYYQL